MQPASKATISVSALTLLITLVVFLVPTSEILFTRHAHPVQSKSSHFRAPKPNVWADLSRSEAKDLYDFLHKSPNHLNLTRHPTTSGWDNYVDLVEVLRPNKTDALAYLDGHGPRPERFARIVVVQQSSPVAMTVDYMVGPLPCRNTTQILPLTYCYNSGRNSVATVIPDIVDLYSFMINFFKNVADIIEDLAGTTLDAFNRISTIDNDVMVNWIQLYRTEHSDASTLLPQGLYVKLNATGRNPSNWHTSQWYYNGILYQDLAAFRAAWESPDFVRVKQNRGGDWTVKENFTANPAGRSLLPPVINQPQVSRYNISLTDSYISYLGWTFYFATDAATGLALFDISFDGERIMYSLQVQEVLVHYAGADPFQGGLAFFDSFFGLGARSFTLVSGYDCPSYADYIDLSYHSGGKMMINKNAICVFEYTSDAPLQRHTSQLGTTVSLNTYLVIRTAATVGNYDYIIDYLFYLDGTIEVKARASGFIFSAFYPSNDTANSPPPAEYGYRLHDAASSSVHDHVLNFRADLDIAGTANSLHRVAIEPLTRTYDWDAPENPRPRNTMHLVHRPVQHETALNWPHNSNEMYIILNPTSTNTWGEKRGYRVLPGSGISNPSHLTIINSTTLLNAAAWANSDLFVLRHHDNEPRSADPRNFLSPSDPLIDFARFLDDKEGIEQEDLVVYFNLGGHHVPTTGDVPNTMMHTSASSVMFVPWNYFDRDASRERVSGVVVAGQERSYFGGHTTEDEDDKQQGQADDADAYRAKERGWLAPWFGFGRAIDVR